VSVTTERIAGLQNRYEDFGGNILVYCWNFDAWQNKILTFVNTQWIPRMGIPHTDLPSGDFQSSHFRAQNFI
jgi:hypothetical protein